MASDFLNKLPLLEVRQLLDGPLLVAVLVFDPVVQNAANDVVSGEGARRLDLPENPHLLRDRVGAGLAVRLYVFGILLANGARHDEVDLECND